MSTLPKLIVILGPTASGKTSLALSVARALNGAIISADSRQIYRKMTIGTGKEPGSWQPYDSEGDVYTVQAVPHFVTDIIDPGRTFTVAEFRDAALDAVRRVIARGQVPLLVGGTGFYIQAIVDNLTVPEVPPNKTLRKSLEQKTLDELKQLILKLDPDALDFLDLRNPRRVIRALEVCIMTGTPFSVQRRRGEPLFDVLQIGIDVPRDRLRERISARVDTMVGAGLWDEVQKLRAQKYDWQLSSMSGIGYREWRGVEEGAIDAQAAVEQIKLDTYNYAKRQMTWFRRDERIRWIQNGEEAMPVIQTFLAQHEYGQTGIQRIS